MRDPLLYAVAKTLDRWRYTVNEVQSPEVAEQLIETIRGVPITSMEDWRTQRTRALVEGLPADVSLADLLRHLDTKGIWNQAVEEATDRAETAERALAEERWLRFEAQERIMHDPLLHAQARLVRQAEVPSEPAPDLAEPERQHRISIITAMLPDLFRGITQMRTCGSEPRTVVLPDDLNPTPELGLEGARLCGLPASFTGTDPTRAFIYGPDRAEWIALVPNLERTPRP